MIVTKSYWVILSGLGSTVTIGANAIKKAGCMIIARNPETSLFSSIPYSIITVGITDFILETALMPTLAADYKENDGEILSSGVDDEKYINTIITLIKQRSAFDFSDYKLSTISCRIIRRANYNNITKLQGYIDFNKFR